MRGKGLQGFTGSNLALVPSVTDLPTPGEQGMGVGVGWGEPVVSPSALEGLENLQSSEHDFKNRNESLLGLISSTNPP